MSMETLTWIMGFVVLAAVVFIVLFAVWTARSQRKPEELAIKRRPDGSPPESHPGSSETRPWGDYYKAVLRGAEWFVSLVMHTTSIILILLVILLGVLVTLFFVFGMSSLVGFEVVWIMLQVVLYLSALAVLVLVTIYEMARNDFGPFTMVGRNKIKSIDSGDGNPKKALANLPKGWVAVGLKVMKGVEKINPFMKVLRRYGIFWKGLPPAKVHVFKFIHERVNPKLKDDTDVADWIQKDPEPVDTDYVLFDKPHWFAVPGVEFSDGFRANILIEVQTQTVDVGVSIYDREGKFFDVMNSQVQAATISICRLMTYDDFTKMDADAKSKFNEELVDSLSDILPQLSGQQASNAFIYRYDASSKEEEQLRRASAQADIELGVAKKRAQGQIADITEAAAALKLAFPEGSSTEIIRTVREIGVADRIKDSGLVAWGAGAMVNTSSTSSGNKNRRGQKKKE